MEFLKFTIVASVRVAIVGAVVGLCLYGSKQAQQRAVLNERSCLLYVLEVLGYEEESEMETQYETLECHFDDSTILKLNGNDSWIKENRHDMISSQTRLIFDDNDVLIDESTDTLIIQNPSNMKIIQEERRRRRLVKEGEPSVLVVKVNGQDKTMSSNEEELARRIFSTQGALTTGPLTSLTQIHACSYGKLSFKPVNDNRFPNGVTSVTLDDNVDGMSMMAVKKLAAAKLTEMYGEDQGGSDYIMYCLPPGAPGNAYAVAQQNARDSWYRDDACMNPSAVLHELGKK